MTYQNNDYKSSIEQIQEFLRLIQIESGGPVTLHVDGIYDKNTSEAVKKFQSENRLPITGTVDNATYDMLYQKALEAEFEQSDPLPIYLFPKGKSVRKGEQSDIVMLIQIIINALTVVYDEYDILEVNGIFDDLTEEAVKIFQRKNNLEDNGIINKTTWNALVENYNKFGNAEYNN